MVSSHSQDLCDLNQSQALPSSKGASKESITDFTLHSQWSNKGGWKTTLNNLRLIIYAKRYPLGQPTILFWMIIPWLEVFPNRDAKLVL